MRQFIHQRLSTLGVLGLLGTMYALSIADWQNPKGLLTLGLILFMIELVPIRMRKISLTFSFPLIFAMALTSGYAATAVISTGLLLIAGVLQRKPMRTVFYNGSLRMVSILAAMWAVDIVHLVSPWELGEKTLPHYLTLLLAAVLAYSCVSALLVRAYLVGRGNRKKYDRLILRMTLLSMAVGIAYDGLMLWIASDPKNTGAGDLGTFFFFSPLVAATLMLHLISNLTRAKNGLETLFTVAQSIHHPGDLQTVLAHILEEATELVQSSCGYFYLVEENGKLTRACRHRSSTGLSGLAKGQGLAGHVALTGEPLLVHDITRDPRYLPGELCKSTRSVLAVPITIDQKVVGVIAVGKKETYSFQRDDLKMMRIFATHVAVVMKNVQYLEEREKRLLVEERNRFARDIHDGLAQDLAGAILQLEMLRRKHPDVLTKELGAIQDSLRRTVTTVRHSIYHLRPAPYSHVGLVPAIRAHLDEVEAQHRMYTALTTEGLPEDLPAAVAKVSFDIVTESVQNAVKHAKATQLCVEIKVEGSLLTLDVKDNGIGFDFGKAILQAAERHSFGIENLYHLAEQVGGTLDILTAPGRGTKVTAEIPWKEVIDDDDPRRVV